MKSALIVVLATIAALPSHAASDVEGRWSGRAQVPGSDLPLVIDLAKDAAGAWIGSMIIPGLDVKGAPLGHIRVTAERIEFDAGDALGAEANMATFKARIDNAGAMSGEMRQAGNVAPFALKRIGSAQVELARHSTRVARETEGRWVGEYEMGGYPRHVTVDIANRDTPPAAVDFVVVGKATTKVPIDFVAEEEGLLRLESSVYRMTFEGRRNADGRIVGTFDTGQAEVPLILRREGAKS